MSAVSNLFLPSSYTFVAPWDDVCTLCLHACLRACVCVKVNVHCVFLSLNCSECVQCAFKGISFICKEYSIVWMINFNIFNHIIQLILSVFVFNYCVAMMVYKYIHIFFIGVVLFCHLFCYLFNAGVRLITLCDCFYCLAH